MSPATPKPAFSSINFALEKGVADELHWNEFVPTAGGELVSPHIRRPGVKNADYMFPSARVVIELKTLQTEFAHTDNVRKKLRQLAAKHPNISSPESVRSLDEELFFLLRKPLKKIVSTANRQIKDTKRELELLDWRGLILIINDGFKGVPPGTVFSLLSDVLAHRDYSNTNGLIYLTNHFVESPESPNALLLWQTAYGNDATIDLVEFVNDLGRKWWAYAQTQDSRLLPAEERVFFDISKTSIVTGPERNAQYLGG